MMNKQNKSNGKRGIEWTDYTWNPIGGCFHGCKWTMPDGSKARCYAMDVALKFTSAYPEGFEHHYWRPDKLDEPLKAKMPSRIFFDSMSDLMGQWIPDDQINQVLDICHRARWHTFQLLTKNAPRLLRFSFPPNVWPGASSAPDYMLGKELSPIQQERYMHKALKTLSELKSNITWMSFEPLSWDVSGIVNEYPGAIQWAVIGAASKGKIKYQPDPNHVQRLLNELDRQGVKVFFKGNLQRQPWREEFPSLDKISIL